MAWMSWADRRGSDWSVDLDRVLQILGSESFSEEKQSRARPITDHHGFFPDTFRITFNWHNIESVVRTHRERKYRRFLDLLYNDGSAAYEMLVLARERSVSLDADLRERQLTAGSLTARNINNAVNNAQAGVDGAILTINVASGILILGATIATGGAAIAGGGGALAMTSTQIGGAVVLAGTLQISGSYAETGRIGEAVIQGATTIICGLVPVARTTMVGRTAAQLLASERMTLFFVGVESDFTSNAAVSLAHGVDVGPAFLNATMSTGINARLSRVEHDLVNGLAFPINIFSRYVAGRGRGAASSYITERFFGSPQRQIAPIRGQVSPSCAVVAADALELEHPISRNQKRSNAERYIQMSAMREGTSPPLNRREVQRVARSLGGFLNEEQLAPFPQ